VSFTGAPKNYLRRIVAIPDNVPGAIVGATGSFEYALLFSAALIVVAIVNYLFLLGKVERIEADENAPAAWLAAMAK
jgi:ACS family glucarate transporter-like MFS transporter